MSHYRVYFLNDREHITGAIDIFAEDDFLAAAEAKSLSDDRPKEVWEGDRPVWRIGRDGEVATCL
jgi:hypothetical protein